MKGRKFPVLAATAFAGIVYTVSPVSLVTPSFGRTLLEPSIVESCPSGHRIEFTLSDATLYLDIHWIEGITLFALSDTYGVACPSGPVKTRRIEFSRAVLRLLELNSGLGEDGPFELYAGADPNAAAPSLQLRQPKNAEAHSESWIEDATPEYASRRFPDWRSYALFYTNASGGIAGMTEVMCVGKLALRRCRSFNWYRENAPPTGIYISYRLPQFRLPAPPLARPGRLYPTDPTTEPGAVLQFDSRFRAWLAAVEHKP